MRWTSESPTYERLRPISPAPLPCFVIECETAPPPLWFPLVPKRWEPIWSTSEGWLYVIEHRMRASRVRRFGDPRVAEYLAMRSPDALVVLAELVRANDGQVELVIDGRSAWCTADDVKAAPGG